MPHTQKVLTNALMRCPIDSYGYPNCDFLHNHMINIHPVRCTKLIRCIKCKKIFTELPALIDHRKECFFDKNNDFKNILENGTEKEFNFKCLKCNVSFNRLKQLADHLCALEDKKFNNENVSDTNNRLQCSTCKVRFKSQNVLDHHRLFHRFHKDFLTDAHILQLSSISYETMKSIRVTLNNIIQCSICKRQFDDLDSLIFHINIDHKKNLNYSQQINLNEIEPYSFSVMAVVKHSSGQLRIIRNPSQIPLATKIQPLNVGVFLCNLCKKVCLSMQLAVTHMLRHKIHYEQITDKKTDLDQIIITKELSVDIGKFKCKNCHVFFKTKIDLDKHLIKNHPQLEVVDIKTEIFEDFQESLLTTIPEYLSDDEDIVMNFVSDLNYTENMDKKEIIKETAENDLNMRSKLTDELNKCLICGSSYYSPQILIDHLKKHRFPVIPEVKLSENQIMPETNKCIMRNGKFECSICRSVLPNLLEMKGHMKCHSLQPSGEADKLMLKCFACDKEFIKEVQLRNHTRLIHGVDSADGYKCGKCDKVFFMRHKYQAHIKHHQFMEKPRVRIDNFKCTFCDRAFQTKSE